MLVTSLDGRTYEIDEAVLELYRIPETVVERMADLRPLPPTPGSDQLPRAVPRAGTDAGVSGPIGRTAG